MNPWNRTNSSKTLAGLQQAQLNNIFLSPLRQKLPAVPQKSPSTDDGYRKFPTDQSSGRSIRVEFNALSLFGK
ncbi:MAG: hypothetical protein IT342_05375 [Candidatus Melainabacteria bacterium]|nr:hypothetical protein [Candidatus Melainabacteria bacterium]